MRTLGKVSILCFGIAAAFAQTGRPAFSAFPLNAGSYLHPELPNGGVARGAMFVLFGINLGPPQIRVVNEFPLPVDLEGTSIRVTVSGTTVDALMIYTSAQQVAAILPSSTPVGNGTLTLTYRGQVSGALGIRVVATAFGVFTRNQAGTGPAIVQNFISETSQPVNSFIDSAQAGQTVILWGTGLGEVEGNEAGGALPGNLGIDVEVYVGGRLAAVIYKGRSGCCAGIDQIVFRVPAGVEGCYVPVAVKAGGVVSNFGSMAIAPGRFCSEASGFSAADLGRVAEGQSVSLGSITLFRIGLTFSAPGGRTAGNFDFANAGVRLFRPVDLLASLSGSAAALSGTPSLGSCTAFPFAETGLVPTIQDPVAGLALDAGAAINLTGPRGLRQLTRDSPGVYSADLGGGIPGIVEPVFPDYLDPGQYTITNGTGGAQVGPFQTTLTLPSPLVWTNQDNLQQISLAQDLTVTWTSGDPERELVTVLGFSAAGESGAAFLCIERASAGRLTVPQLALSALPQSGPTASGVPFGFLAIGASPQPESTRFTTRGLDLGAFSYLLLQMRNTDFR